MTGVLPRGAQLPRVTSGREAPDSSQNTSTARRRRALRQIQTYGRMYFCDPRSPWQRGTNENTNRLLRQSLSKTGDLTADDHQALDAIAASMAGPAPCVSGRVPPYGVGRSR
jgi:hypothetical protein